jgi:hypothetical protein
MKDLHHQLRSHMETWRCTHLWPFCKRYWLITYFRQFRYNATSPCYKHLYQTNTSGEISHRNQSFSISTIYLCAKDISSRFNIPFVSTRMGIVPFPSQIHKSRALSPGCIFALTANSSISESRLISYSDPWGIWVNIKQKKLNSMVWVRERTIPTERPPLVDEAIANFCG